MYTDYYLRFKNEAEALSVLYRTDGAVEAEVELGIEAKEGYQVANFANISVIGTIYNDDGAYDEEGAMVTTPTAQDGFFVNVRASGNEPMELIEPYKIEVLTPMRVWG